MPIRTVQPRGDELGQGRHSGTLRQLSVAPLLSEERLARCMEILLHSPLPTRHCRAFLGFSWQAPAEKKAARMRGKRSFRDGHDTVAVLVVAV